MENDAVTELVRYAMENGRICPQPIPWDEMWKMLPNRRKEGKRWLPAVPLILAAWWVATDEQKAERFHLHIRWAVEHGALTKVEAFLKNLDEEDWYHIGD